MKKTWYFKTCIASMLPDGTPTAPYIFTRVNVPEEDSGDVELVDVWVQINGCFSIKKWMTGSNPMFVNIEKSNKSEFDECLRSAMGLAIEI